MGRYLGAGIAFSAIGLVGVGVGILFAGLLVAVSGNPRMVDRLFGLSLLGFALVESAILFALLSGFFILFI